MVSNATSLVDYSSVGAVEVSWRAGVKSVCSVLLSLLCLPSIVAADDDGAGHVSSDLPKTWAVVLPVSDIDVAQDFWTRALTLRTQEMDLSDSARVLGLGELRLILYRHPGGPRETGPGRQTRIYPNFEVADLEGSAARIARYAGQSGSIEPNAIGEGVLARDPSGNRFNLMTIQGRSLAPGSEVQPFNVGIRVPRIEPVEGLLRQLGQEVSTRSYLPETLPFVQRGRFPLVVHRGASGPADDQHASASLVFSVPDLEQEARRLESIGVAARRGRAPWGSESVLLIPVPANLSFVIVERAAVEPGI